MTIGSTTTQGTTELKDCEHVWEFEDETIEHDISEDEYYIDAYYVHFMRCQTCGKSETMFSNTSYYDEF